ncbi:MAG: ABC transporter permease subunit [Planctomycetota bacterium]|jgi:ABC-type amino acid transport system permease subunit
MTAWEILQLLVVGLPVPEEMAGGPLAFLGRGGLLLSLSLSGAGIVIALPFGLLLALGREAGAVKPGRSMLAHWGARVVRGGSTMVVEGIRGLPSIVWFLLVFYLPYRLFAVRIAPEGLALLALSSYGAVYLSEIFRSGFRAVRPGWVEAGVVLGLGRWQRFRTLVLPLVFRTMLPSLVNLAVTLFKDTSVLMVVGVGELTYTSRQLLVSEPGSYALILGLVLLLYWFVAALGSGAASLIERQFRLPAVVGRGCFHE